MKILLSKFLLCTSLLLFTFSQSLAQDQLAIWTFPSLSSVDSGDPLSPTTQDISGSPTVTMYGGDIDDDGISGKAYIDVEGVSHTASRAIRWDEDADDGSLIIAFNTLGFTDIHLRFDYKSFGTENFDLDVKYSPAGSYTELVGNGNLDDDESWHSRTIDLSSHTSLNNQGYLAFRINDFDDDDDALLFDNIEIYGIKTNTCEPYLASALPSAGPLCEGETENLDLTAFNGANSLSGVTYTYKNPGGSGSVSVNHPSGSSAAASVTGLSAGSATLRLVVDDEGCKDSVEFSVVVNAIPAQLAQQNCANCGKIKISICQLADFPDLDAIIEDGNANYEEGANLNWYQNSGGEPGAYIEGTPSFNNNVPKTKRYWVTQEKNDCESDAIMVVITVEGATAVVFNMPAIGCHYGLLDLSDWVSDPFGTASSYTFYDSDPSVGNPTPLGSVSATNGVVDANESVIEELQTGLQTYYVVANNSKGCGSSAQTSIQVYEKPYTNAVSNRSANHGQAVNVSFSGGPGSVSFIWMNDNTDIGLGAMGNGNISFIADNTTGQTQVANIKVLSTNIYCISDWEEFTITVASGAPNREAQAEDPSTFLSFMATKANEANVQLSWTSSYEVFILGYEVEKRVNNSDEFVTIGQQTAQGDDFAYQMLDQGGMGNQNVYRLKVNLLDGSVQYSEEVEVGFDFVNNNRFSLYPNPNSGKFTIEAAFPLEEDFNWQLSDVMGKVVSQGQTNQQNTSFDISHLPSGIYHLVMISAEGQRYLNRVIKE